MRSDLDPHPVSRLLTIVASLLLGLLVMGSAQAEPDPLDLLGPPVSPVPRGSVLDSSGGHPAGPTRFYGYQILLADLGSLALVSGAFGQGAQMVGVATFVTVPPIIHLVHGNIFRTVLSPVMRIVLPLAGVYAGQKIMNCAPRDEYCALVGGLLGGGSGLLAAVSIDGGFAWSDDKSSLFANGDQPGPRKEVPTMAFTTAGLLPMPNRGAAVMLGGNF